MRGEQDHTSWVGLAYSHGHPLALLTETYVDKGVSPWQFKDFNDGYYNSWVEYSDVLFPNRWQQAISTVQPDIVEIITWNDFEESHYIRDLPPVAGPAAVGFGVTGAYIYGQTHSAWRVMAQYYISWYKTGLAPKVSGC